MVSDLCYQLPQIPYLRLRFALIAEQKASLPAFKGSMLRGAFGHALRQTVCVMGPQQPCPTCMLRKQCVYPRLFETLIEPDEDVPRFLRGLPTAPRPYIFEPFDQGASYGADDTLQFDLILLGRVIELFPYAIFAVAQMAENGLSARRYRFRLHDVKWEEKNKSASVRVRSEELQVASEQLIESEWRLLYDGAAKRLLENPTAQLPTMPPAFTSYLPLLTCNFLTPTRLKFKDGLTMEFTFRMLVFKMLRRVLELAHFHVPGATIDWEFHPLLVAADEVKIIRRNLEWVDWERRSNRQKTEMKMGGFVGEMVLEGELAPFLDLLRMCEVVHVGKGCVFGNGKMVCSVGLFRDTAQ
jgi:hypothetical protein